MDIFFPSIFFSLLFESQYFFPRFLKRYIFIHQLYFFSGVIDKAQKPRQFFFQRHLFIGDPSRVCSRTLRTPFVHYLSDRLLCKGGFTDETKTIYLGDKHNVISGAFSAFTVKSHNFFFLLSPVGTPVDCVTLCIIGPLSTA